MDEQLLVARRYLSPPANSFWNWSDDGQVVVWGQGETIAFREELTCVLKRLAPSGLPPIGAVVLLLAACRSSWGECSAQFARDSSALVNVERRILPQWLTDSFALLDQVNRLEPSLRTPTEAKAELAASVFEAAPQRSSPEDAARVVAALDRAPPAELLEPRLASLSMDALLESLRALREGLGKLDPEALRSRLRTGLEQTVKPAEEEEFWPADRVRDRFFLSRDAQWYALSYDGLQPRLERVCKARTPQGAVLVALFDCPYEAGPVGVTDDGQLWFTASGSGRSPAHRLAAPVRVCEIARNGKRLVLEGRRREGPGGQLGRALIFAANAVSQTVFGDPLNLVERELWEVVRPLTLRRRFTGIYADRSSIHLVSRKHAHLRFSLLSRSHEAAGAEASEQLRFAQVDPPNDAKPIAFEPLATDRDVGYTLRVAQWPDGSRAFLDSRGLLHLKSSDPEIPEISLVLYEGATACWSSSGKLGGSPYFTGRPQGSEARDIFLTDLTRFANAVQ